MFRDKNSLQRRIQNSFQMKTCSFPRSWKSRPWKKIWWKYCETIWYSDPSLANGSWPPSCGMDENKFRPNFWLSLYCVCFSFRWCPCTESATKRRWKKKILFVARVRTVFPKKKPTESETRCIEKKVAGLGNDSRKSAGTRSRLSRPQICNGVSRKKRSRTRSKTADEESCKFGVSRKKITRYNAAPIKKWLKLTNETVEGVLRRLSGERCGKISSILVIEIIWHYRATIEMWSFFRLKKCFQNLKQNCI